MQPIHTLSRVFNDFVTYRRRRTHGPAGDNPLGQLRATVPISRAFGFDRGTPVDRVFVERYLATKTTMIRGRVLEIGDNEYTLTYGGERVTKSDILHFDADNPKATFVGDLSACDHIEDALFDCIILTQTLHLIYDIQAALANVHRLLKPGGTVIATFPGISQISDEDWGSTWCWGWSPGQAASLLQAAFPGGEVEAEALGNRFAAAAFLHGLTAEELDQDRLLSKDGACAFVVGATATRAASGSRHA
jgi:SAM-dependent methyltransferase